MGYLLWYHHEIPRIYDLHTVHDYVMATRQTPRPQRQGHHRSHDTPLSLSPKIHRLHHRLTSSRSPRRTARGILSLRLHHNLNAALSKRSRSRHWWARGLITLSTDAISDLRLLHSTLDDDDQSPIWRRYIGLLVPRQPTIVDQIRRLLHGHRRLEPRPPLHVAPVP